jgi:hypothetical protein
MTTIIDQILTIEGRNYQGMVIIGRGIGQYVGIIGEFKKARTE